MPFRINFVEELGAQRLVHGDIEGQPVTVTVAPSVPLSTDMHLAIRPDALLLFETATGQRLPDVTGAGAAKPVPA